MRYQNECYNQLLEFVETHENWQELLKQKPYSLKSIKQCPWNSNWYMLVYNLFESELRNPIVKACRGSVIDVSDPKDVKLICAPYLKFCNLGEFPDEDAKIDWSSVKISEKIDGILIKACKHNDEFHWFTNGSFELNAPLMGATDKYIEKETDKCETFCDLLVYAIKKIGYTNVEVSEEGSRLITKGGWAELFPEGCTLCMELVSPKNKILCDYPESKLYWHGYRDEDMNEKPVENIHEIVSNQGYEFIVDIPKKYSLNKITPAAVKAITDSFDGSEQEGVVICDKNWHRAKIKSDSYLHLKFMRDVNNISDKNIFHYILADEIDDITCDANRDKINAMKNVISDFKDNYNRFVEIVKNVYANLGNDRKEFAIKASDNFGKRLIHMAFKALDNISADNFLIRTYANKYKDFLRDSADLITFLEFDNEGKL